MFFFEVSVGSISLTNQVITIWGGNRSCDVTYILIFNMIITFTIYFCLPWSSEAIFVASSHSVFKCGLVFVSLCFLWTIFIPVWTASTRPTVSLERLSRFWIYDILRFIFPLMFWGNTWFWLRRVKLFSWVCKLFSCLVNCRNAIFCCCWTAYILL